MKESKGIFHRFRRGSVLVMALVTVFVAATITGAMCAYFVSSANIAKNVYIKLDKNRDDNALVQAIVSRRISEVLEQLVGSDMVSAIGGGGAEMIKNLKDGLKANVDGKTEDFGDGFRAEVTLSDEEIARLDNLTVDGKEQLTIEIDIYKDGEFVGKYAMYVEFYTVGVSTLTTLPVFDYVYFASKYGHLYPSAAMKLVINGSVHSNGKFDIDNTTINGFISASNGVNVSSSKIWPYKTYQNRIAARYNTVLTQVRPPTPTRTDENVATGIEWKGGYEPVEAEIGTYSAQPPTNVVDGVQTEEPKKGEGEFAYPDTPEPKKGEGEFAYAVVEEPKKGEGEYAYPDTPEPKKGEGEFAYEDAEEPIKGQGKYAYPSDPEPIKGEGKYAYTGSPEPIKGEGKYAYPNTPEPIKGQGDYAYPTTAEPKKGEGIYKYNVEPTTKYPDKPTKATVTEPPAKTTIKEETVKETKIEKKTVFTYNGTDYETKAKAEAQQTTDKRNITKKTVKNKGKDVTVYVYNATQKNGKTKETQYDTEAAAKAQQAADGYAITEAKKDVETTKDVKKFLYNGVYYDTKKKAEEAYEAAKKKYDEDVKKAESDYQAALTEWEKKKKEIDDAHAAWVKDCEAKDAAWKTAHDAWQKARDDKDALWKTAHDAWQKARDDKDALWKTDHDAWLAAGGDDRPAKDALWQKDHDAWLAARKAKDDEWQKDHDAWEKSGKSDREAKDKAWEAAHKAWQDARDAQDAAWQEAHDYWEKNGHASIVSAAEQDAKWQVAHDAWQKARDDKDAEWQKAHDKWQEENAGYAAQHAAYLKYLEDLKAWTAGFEQWILDRRAEINNGSFEADINEKTCTAKTNRIIVGTNIGIPMPDISPTEANITKYKNFCKNYKISESKTGGTLTCLNLEEDGSRMVLTNVCEKRVTYRGVGATYGGQTFAMESKNPRKLAQVKIVNGCDYGSGFAGYPFEYESGSAFEALKETEKNSVILIGTTKSPIEIDGPVFIDGDVLIRGIVRGRGSIYASRNIHIIGDLIYETPPTWPATYMTDKSKGPDKVAEANESKDLLSLIAMKSIVVGDYTSDTWQGNANMSCLPAAYKQADGGKKVNITFNDNGWDNKSNWYMMGNGTLHKIAAGAIGISTGNCLYEDLLKSKFPTLYQAFGYTYYVAFAVNTVSASASVDNTRKQYETVLGNYIVQSFQPADPPRSLRDRILGTTPDPAGEIFTDAHFITQIDGILFANNGVIGEVGGRNKHQFTLNGGIICTDECIFPSFSSRYTGAGGETPTIWLNWDLRVRSDAKGGVRIGLEEDYRDDSNFKIKAHVISLQQVQ